jgi:5-methylcytosine-specific restriction protein A
MTHRLCRCGAIVKGRCLDCDPYAKKKQVRYTKAWDKLSVRYRKENPLCEECDRRGMTTPATEVHHIVKVSEDPKRMLDVTNLVSVCRACHEKLERGMKW